MLLIKMQLLQKMSFTISTIFRLELLHCVASKKKNLFMQKNTVTEILLIHFCLASAERKYIFWLMINKSARKWSCFLFLCTRPFRIQIFMSAQKSYLIYKALKKHDVQNMRYTMQSHKKIYQFPFYRFYYYERHISHNFLSFQHLCQT